MWPFSTILGTDHSKPFSCSSDGQITKIQKNNLNLFHCQTSTIQHMGLYHWHYSAWLYTLFSLFRIWHYFWHLLSQGSKRVESIVNLVFDFILLCLPILLCTFRACFILLPATFWLFSCSGWIQGRKQQNRQSDLWHSLWFKFSMFIFVL